MAFWSKDTDTGRDEAPNAGSAARDAAPPPPPAKEKKRMARDDRQTGEMNALLGRGASFEGKLTFEGTVRIDGNFKGEILTDDVLVIGEGAKVEAEVRVGSVVVNGEVTGNIIAKQAVELHQPAKVVGNITTPSLIIEKGVVFEGNCSMQSGGAAATKPAAPPPRPAESAAAKS